MTNAVKTTDHDEIREWIEERGGRPSRVKGAAEGGILRVDFGNPEDELEEIGWEEFFQIFDENDLAFLYQEEVSSGEMSRFNKFVDK